MSQTANASTQLRDFLQAYPVNQTWALQWGDMDALSHVNNVVYFRYFENVRIEYMSRTAMIGDPRLGPVLAETQASYRRPLTFPDTISVGARVSEIHSHGCEQEYAVFSHQQDTVTTHGRARIVLLDSTTGRKTAMPPTLIAEIERLEGDKLGR